MPGRGRRRLRHQGATGETLGHGLAGGLGKCLERRRVQPGLLRRGLGRGGLSILRRGLAHGC